jgi:acetyl esterase/lipase
LLLPLVAVLLRLNSVHAEIREPVPLWPNGAPGALGTSTNDIPTLTAYRPAPGTASGAAIVVCPGGGYGGLAGHEGHDYALFLNRAGVTAFVLKYRLGSHGYRHPAMLLDAARAVRWVRAHATEFAVDPKRVGIMGSSAGGHLASTLMTHFDAGDPQASDPVERMSSRPDLGVLCYPVITMEAYGHAGSRRNLLGEFPSADQIHHLSNEKQVSPGTPPAFVWHTWEDQAVPVRNALEFAAALERSGVPFDLHVYKAGRHGIGLGARPPDFEQPHPWAQDLVFWLKGQGFVK